MAKIEGRNPVIEALKADRKIRRLILQKGISGERIDWIITEAEKQGIPLEWTARENIDEISYSHSHQGVLAFAAELQLVKPEAIVEYAAEKNEKPLIIILDQLQDPHNFGSIIRTAAAAGAHGIIYQKKRAVDITPVVVKSSAGALEHIMLAQVSNINYTIDKLKEMGVWIAGAEIDGDMNYFKLDYQDATAVVIGNEGSGLRRLVKEKCDFLLKIPMPGKIDSLNASVAAGIIIYEAARQRIT